MMHEPLRGSLHHYFFAYYSVKLVFKTYVSLGKIVIRENTLTNRKSPEIVRRNQYFQFGNH